MGDNAAAEHDQEHGPGSTMNLGAIVDEILESKQTQKKGAWARPEVGTCFAAGAPPWSGSVLCCRNDPWSRNVLSKPTVFGKRHAFPPPHLHHPLHQSHVALSPSALPGPAGGGDAASEARCTASGSGACTCGPPSDVRLHKWNTLDHIGGPLVVKTCHIPDISSDLRR
ncbi:hypothetical protein MTO96_027337 [Rhipicephalus appendiculatus]